MNQVQTIEAIARKSEESRKVQAEFFSANDLRIYQCANKMHACFEAGGKLLVAGNGGSSCDAAHIAVEFMHPIFEKRRPLPALALNSDSVLLSAIGNDQDQALVCAHQVGMYGRPGDIFLAISTSGKSENMLRALRAAKEQGLLTVTFTGKDGGHFPDLSDFSFVVPSFSIHRIQETHVALLHIIWDVIHMARGEEDVI